jgi:hypothetical protein
MADSVMCACGRPLHYRDPAIQRFVETIVASWGPEVKVTVGYRTWLVQRHYLALHGLEASEVATLGFLEITSHE